MKIVIVGGVAGGASAAAKARRTDEGAEIVLYEKGPYVSFANCGLPYYISGEIRERNNLFLMDPDRFRENHNVTVKVNSEVISIDRIGKTVSVKDRQTGETTLVSYDRLILSPGADALRPPIPGINAENIFPMKTVPDADSLKKFLTDNQIQKVSVIGGGFIGLEMVEAFLGLGVSVTLVEKLDQVLPPLDRDMAEYISLHLEENGVKVILENGVSEFLGKDGRCTAIKLEDGNEIATDAVILSIGVRPNIDLAKEAGLELTLNNRLVKVNERMETSDPDIYAVGDIVSSVHTITGQEVWIPLAGPANKQGRVAGTNAAGGDMKMPTVLGTAIARVLHLTVAKTGLGEKEAKSLGFNYSTSYTHAADHAGYYPGAAFLSTKLLYEKETGRLLGAQIVGKNGVDKRTDVYATAMKGGLTVQDVAELDLAYAPPFSSAKDPAIVAGNVAVNTFVGACDGITAEETLERVERGDDFQLVDVRTPGEYKGGGLKGAVNIPLQQLRERYAELDAEKETVVYCRIGLRGYLASRILQQKGFARVKNLMGGMISVTKRQ